MYFAHGTEETVSNSSRLMDNAAFAIPFVTLVTCAVLMTILWLLKRYTTWRFPTTNERKK